MSFSETTHGLKAVASRIGIYWFFIYFLTIAILTFSTVSEKYPFAQKLSPHRNSFKSGNSSRIILLLPTFEKLNSPTNTNVWSQLYNHMNMVNLNIKLMYFPSVHYRTFSQQFFYAFSYFLS